MIRRALILIVTSLTALVPLEARGRQPDDGRDGFPDYNRLELHPRTPPAPAISTDTEKLAPPSIYMRPSLNAPVKTISEEDLPKPPPPVVHGAATAGEPPMPDEILDTLNSTTTAPSPAASTPTAPTLMNK